MKVGDILRSKKTGRLFEIHEIDGPYVHIGPEGMSYIDVGVADIEKTFEVIPKEESE